MRTSASFIGRVQRVLGPRVFVAVDNEVPSANPILDGRLYRLGQIGSFVKIPIGFHSLFGIVMMIGSSEWLKVELNLQSDLPPGQRWLEIQLVGEVLGSDKFQRGVSMYPTLNDEVHLVTEQDLTIIYRNAGSAPIEIGSHALSEGLPATIDVEKLLTRHGAILGSTGSGKSNTVAGLLKSLSANYPNSRVIVIDPHGEYGAAFQGIAKVFRIGDSDSSNKLIVPYWAMGFDELAWFFVDRRTGGDSPQDAILRGKIYEMRKKMAEDLVKEQKLSDDEITVDAPIAFDIRQLWYELDFQDRATYNTKERKKGDEAVASKGDAAKLIPATFSPPAPGGAAPFKADPQLNLTSHLTKLFGRLKDRRFSFVCETAEYDGKQKDLHDLVDEWIDHPEPLTVFDLGGVPADVLDLVVGMITRILFELSFWGRDLEGVGRQKPILLVLEEAHSYIPRGEGRFIQGFARRSVQRIFKEGRKYGIGAVVVSQRPSELDDTVLAQCGTFFALRLTNSEDQSRVRSTVPDVVAGLIDLLPSLRNGEMILVGEAVPIPCRIRVPLVTPRTKSDDPKVSESWNQAIQQSKAGIQVSIARWRAQDPEIQIRKEAAK